MLSSASFVVFSRHHIEIPSCAEHQITKPMVTLPEVRIESALAFIVISLWSLLSACPALAAGREVKVPDAQFQPVSLPRAVTIGQAVAVALRNFPTIAKKQFELRAANANVFLAKT